MTTNSPELISNRSKTSLSNISILFSVLFQACPSFEFVHSSVDGNINLELISNINVNNVFQVLILVSVLLQTPASFASSPSPSVDGLTSWTPGLYQSQAALEATISTGSSSILFCYSLVPLSDLPPLLSRTVWRHKGKDSINLKTNWNWPFLPDHLWYCSLAHRYLFQIFPLFLRKRFDVIKCHTLTISSINSNKPFQPFIFLFVLWSMSVYWNTSKSSFP